ncbi:A24 family peptidase [Kribbella sp. NPDC003557]|uniref:prepilin peptidase n=1 Tax=Kribbella sp. NPDC003557 TaxID=3154449 RepID=UPI0033AD724C
MNIEWALAGGAVGLVAGLLLRGTVFQLSVASGEPLRTTCQRCAGPVGGRFAFRCRSCHRWLGRPLVLELATAAVLGLLLWRFAGEPAAAGFAFVGVIGVALAAIDISVQRLPDRLTLPLYPGLVALFGLAAIVDGHPSELVRALLGGSALGGGYLVLAILSRGQLGGGDVKLAGGLGIALGWLGWPTLLTGAAAGFVLMGVVSVALLLAGRIAPKDSISFGPFMLAGALLTVLTGT